MGTVGCLRPITPCAFGLMLGNLHAEKSTDHATIITSTEPLIIDSMTGVTTFFKCTGGCGKRFAGAFISHVETHLRARNVTLAWLDRGWAGPSVSQLTCHRGLTTRVRNIDLRSQRGKANPYSEAFGCVTNSVWIISFERGCS